VVRVRVVHGALKKCAVSQTKKSKKKTRPNEVETDNEACK
jgi:hypothetical protein